MSLPAYHRYMCFEDCAEHGDNPCIAESISYSPDTCFYNGCKVHWEEVPG